MSSSKLSRREAFGVGIAFGGAAMTAPLWASGQAAAAAPAAFAGRKPSPFKIGIASYSLRKFPLEKIIEMVKGIGVKYVTLKDVHLARTDPPETDARVRKKIDGRRHHDHGRRHAHLEGERRGGDPQGFRVREERRLPADGLLTGARDARHAREAGEGVRHQGRHSQSRSRGQVVPGAGGRARRSCRSAIRAWASAWTSATPSVRAPTSSSRSRSPDRSCSTCT